MSPLFTAEDGQPRCGWCAATPDYVSYHDREWGFPVADDRRLFEKICLEGFQSGLSWRTILAKRENFRAGFAGFDFEAVARFGEDDVTRLLADAGIVRHRGKIEATINNAARAVEMVTRARRLLLALRNIARRSRRAANGIDHRHIGGVVEGAEASGLEIRRPHHGLCLHAGDGPGE